ncbi:TniQ protein [Tardiphaga sp. OK246]|nr:TniQ protein [Tardiphaga sp. OK246]
MTLALALTIPLMDDEPTIYFASRLAARNFQDGRKLGSDMAFRFIALERGCHKAIAQLAEVSGADFDRLLRNSPKPMGGNLDLGGQELGVKSRHLSRLFICPACLQADVDRGDLDPTVAIRSRIQWTLRAIGTCIDHGIALTPVAEEKNQHIRHDWTKLVAPILKDLPALMDRAVRRPASKLELYLVDRLNNGTAGSWLDRLPFFAAEQTAHLFGCAALFGNAAVRDLNDEQKYAAGDAGFEIVRNGSVGIENFLSKLHAKFVPNNKNFSPYRAYGRVYTRLSLLADDPAFREVRDIVVEHAPSKFPLGPGDEIMGVGINARQFHSVWSLSKQFRCSWKRIEHIMIAAGFSVNRQPNGQEAMFEASQAEATVERAMQSVSLLEAQERLGASESIMNAVLDSGRLKRHRVDQGYHGLRFYSDDLDEFLQILMDGTEPVIQPTSEMVTLKSATARTRCKIAKIIRMIIDKKLRWVGHHVGLTGLASLLVYPADVAAALGRTPPEGLSVPEASQKLRIAPPTLRKLAALHLIASRKVLDPLSGLSRLRFSTADVDRFDEQYVTLWNLSKKLSRGVTRLRRELDALNVMPVPGMDGLHSTFYLRSDVAIYR